MPLNARMAAMAAAVAEEIETTDRAAFVARLDAFTPDADEDERKRVTCAVLGHSRIQTTFFGYYYCARCGDLVGDSLGSSYAGAETAVIVGHKCDRCVANYAACTWRDKLYAPEPFPEGGPETGWHYAEP